ncbi:branched-chain amino acid transporter AzlC [Exiguobacterium sp. KRL4]|uniref:AzlC family ABC transporter permease n=1 Tax=Exiguobacterium sp. KRL4 TaxID=1914536 RepID=UPI0008F95FDF|nr:AzlC family ABC transporter permease [Exiguobacterium sp. KRL4]OIN68278.1 branched-chain amino acid transporter AzlC [Exiguobacterium sp. KRL4]
MASSFQAGVKACLPTVLGYLGIGFSAGIVGRAAGLSPLEIGLMSILIYAGAAQFIITSLLLLNSPFSAIILTTFIVNSRHLLMSMTLAPRVASRNRFDQFGIGALLTDESFAVAMNTSLKQTIDAKFMHGLNLTAYFSWIASTVLGALVGSWFPDPERFGLDFALTAMFIGLLYLQFESERSRVVLNAILLVMVFVLLYISMRYLSPELAVLFATMTAASMGVVISRWKSV